MGSLGKGHLMIRRLELKKANNGINLVKGGNEESDEDTSPASTIDKEVDGDVTSHISIQ